jgi:uracil-DNA glycosylase family 4
VSSPDLATLPAAAEPPHDCPLCPRLAAFRAANRQKFPDWWNAPVPSWGDSRPGLVIVGLAPGLRGANRTGRPGTGDYAGNLLFSTLSKFGLATGTYEARPDDSLKLRGAVIVNAVRCVPPENKPLPVEIATCRRFLIGALEAHPAGVYLALGRIAHEALLAARGEPKAKFPFAHGAAHALSDGSRLFDSYHCSRQNTNTGRLTTAMFEEVVGRAAGAVKGGR